MAEDEQPTPLHSHTLQTLCVELVSGRAIAIDESGEKFQILSENTRSLFNWYRQNSNRWAGNVRKEDVESIVDCLDKTPPILPKTQIASSGGTKRDVYIKKVEVHNFGGIHRFQDLSLQVDDFSQELDSRIVLVEGGNGSGKSSLLSAICWALTAQVFRSQRAPEEIGQQIPLEVVDDPVEGQKYDMTPITPLPPAEFLKTRLAGKAVPLDTWVELTFSDEIGSEIGKLRRTLTRSARGKPEVVVSDTGFLNLDPVAFRVGTAMPGLIPYIKLGEGSELGEAIAALTGIQPLEDLVSHATRVKDKLKSDFVRERNAEIQKVDESYTRIKAELLRLFEEHAEIKPGAAVPLPSSKDAEATLEEIKRHLSALQGAAFSDAKGILGETFDPGNSDSRKNLRDSVAPALALIEFSSLGTLESAQRLNNLRSLSDDDVSQAETLISDLFSESAELAEMASDPQLASRLRLYARVAGWLRDTGGADQDVDLCPVCQTPLDDKTDSHTHRPVKDHIGELLVSNKTYLEKTLDAWVGEATRRLRSGICKTLQGETHTDLPSLPTDLIRRALVDELFSATTFKGSLSPLKSATEKLCDKYLNTIAVRPEPKFPTLPPQFEHIGKEFLTIVVRIYRAINFSRWRAEHVADLSEAFKKIIGDKGEIELKEMQSASPTVERSLRDRLLALNRLVNNASPINDALGKIDALVIDIGRRRKIEDRLTLYGRTAIAIEQLTKLDTLVEKQVKSLMAMLGGRTQYWRSKLYQSAYAGAPEYVSSSINSDGAISIDVKAGGTKVPAQHVSNASDLRATLLAFLFAFWEHLRTSRGVLSTFLMDDLQELFDPPNRQRIANTIPDLVSEGARVVITTNDQEFSRKLASCSLSKSIPILHKRIHPLSARRACIVLVPFQEEIDRKKREFENPDNENNDQPARDYIKDLRIYLENRLLDLLNDYTAALPDSPGLSDLINAVRQARTHGHAAFSSGVYKRLVDNPALKQQSSFLNLMNQSHHGKENLITFNSVLAIKDDCERVRDLVDAAYLEYQVWMRRDIQAKVEHLPSLPAAFVVPAIQVSVLTKLAAFAGDASTAEAVDLGDKLDGSIFEKKAIYYVKTRNFGFSGAGNFRAIVSLDDAHPAEDNSLVIAISGTRTYARRLLRNRSNTTTIALGAEVEDPRNRPPSLILRTEETRLLPVVGIIIDDTPNYEKNQDEATIETASTILTQVKLAFRVTGDSALPLALPGQIVLGGDCIAPNELNKLEGALVAIATSDGALLKRIGAAVTGHPHIRQFEAIGGRGDSILVRTEDIDDHMSKIPLMISCRKIVGIVY